MKMKTSDQDDCVLCCREIAIYAVGVCDHPVCYECSARMRVLCETNECPICRSDMPIVICTLEKQPFSKISKAYSLIDKKLQVVFQNADIQASFQLLLENRCKICDEVFYTFNKLKDHVRREHGFQYCELCSENLKIFPFERKTYNRKDLARHKRLGDPDETSHRGHPLCEFCEQRYVDSDELFRHLRREHFFCHFCDADGKHQYYENYDYLRVHFRKEHYLCEEGDCANEMFIGAFRSEIDLKAHIAVHHSRNKSKAEARQARTLDVEFTYAHHNRPSGNSSPRGNRYNHHRKQNVEEKNSRENKSIQPAEIEKINTQSTLEFPYLSEDCENASVPSTNANSITLQSFNRNPVSQRQKSAMSSEDFPALLSTTVNVTSEVTNNQNRQINFSVLSQNNMPARGPNVSIHVSQKSAQPKKEADRNQKSTWISKKNATFDDEFPKLETKKSPPSYTNMVTTTVIKNIQSRPAVPSVEVVPNPQGGSDQFIVIKNKPKKKKHNRAILEDSKVSNYKDESDEKDEAVNSLLLSNNNFNLLDDDYEDKYKKYMVRANTKPNYIEEDRWQQRVVSFGKDDFPPLAASEPLQRPPVLNGPRKKAPPPGFGVNSNTSEKSAPLNITLSSIARQIVAPNINKTKIPQSNFEYKKPLNFSIHNNNLSLKIQQLSVFDEFKTLSAEFRKSDITAATYYSKCLGILGEQDFSDIFPELICLLPDINKQQELLDIHKKHKNNSGAVPKQKLLNSKISSCDLCYQVLMESDYQRHILEHEME